MAINVNPNDTPNDDPESNDLSASEVPVNHMMAINDSDSDFDDSDDTNYELLTTQEVAEGVDQTTTYYPHNYLVDWIDWDQIEGQLETNDCPTDSQTISDTNDRPDSQEVKETTESLEDRQISLSDDRINEIKTLMSGFDLPTDCIPVWAQNMPEEDWKSFLTKRFENK